MYAKDKETHDKKLQTVINILTAEELSLNMSKCEFGRTELMFLGHITSGDGIRPDPEKVKAVQSCEAPKNVSELQTFLGLVNYVKINGTTRKDD